MFWAEKEGKVPAGTAKEWESNTKNKKLPNKVKVKKGCKDMKKADTFINNLISRPLDLDQHIASTLDPSAMKYIILLRYLTKDKDVNDPVEFDVDSHTIHIHRIEQGMYSGYLMGPDKQIIMEFNQQSLPIIGSMLAAKLEIMAPIPMPVEEIPQPIEALPVEPPVLSEEKNESPVKEISISVCPSGHVDVVLKKAELIPGGKAEGMVDSGFDAMALENGKQIEMEHTTNPELAKEIAKDHLSENPKYYEYLRLMEDKMDRDKKLDDLDDRVKFLSELIRELIRDKAAISKSKKSRLFRMWKIFNIDMPDLIGSEDDLFKATDGILELSRYIENQGKTLKKSIFIALMACKDKYGFEFIEKSQDHFDKLEKCFASYTDQVSKVEEILKGVESMLNGDDIEKTARFKKNLQQKIEKKLISSGIKSPSNTSAWISRRLNGPKRLQGLKKPTRTPANSGNSIQRKVMKKSSIIDSFTPDERIQPKDPKEMHELKKSDADAKFSGKQFDETKQGKGLKRVDTKIEDRVEKLIKSNDNAAMEELKKAQVEQTWKNHEKVNYCDKDTRSNAEKYWDNSRKDK